MTVTTVSVVNITVPNNVWWLDAFQFGTVGDTSWSFAHQEFLCDLKSDPTVLTPDMALSSVSSPPTIVVLDEAARILTFDVTDHMIRAHVQPGPYTYDLIMVDMTTGERRRLMKGVITIEQGITIED